MVVSSAQEIVAEYCAIQDIRTVCKNVGACKETSFSNEKYEKKVVELRLLRSIKNIQPPKLSKEQLSACWDRATDILFYIDKNSTIKYSTGHAFSFSESKRARLRFYFDDIHPWEAYPISEYETHHISEYFQIPLFPSKSSPMDIFEAAFHYDSSDSINVASLVGKNILVKWGKKFRCFGESDDNFISGNYYIKIAKKCEKTDSLIKKPSLSNRYSFIDDIDNSEFYNTEYLSKIDSISSGILYNADSLFDAILNEVKNFKNNGCPIVTIPEVLFYNLKEFERINIVKYIQELQMLLDIRDSIYEESLVCNMSKIIDDATNIGGEAINSNKKFLNKYNIKYDHTICLPSEAASACSIHLSSKKSNDGEYTFFFNKTSYRLAKLPNGTYVLRKMK